MSNMPLTKGARFTTGLALLFVVSQALGQHRNDNWLITGNWVTFQSGVPVNVEDPPQSAAGPVLSDTNGTLKVYASSEGLRNSSHLPIGNHPDYPPLPFVGSSEKTGVFLPRPGFPDEAYFIGLHMDNSSGSPVRRMGILTLNLGGPSSQPMVLDTGFTWFMQDPMRKCMALPHANGTDYWFVAQLSGGNTFHAYLVSGAGISGPPVLSSAGPVAPADWFHGKMVPNFQGDRFANVMERSSYSSATATPESLSLLEFDNATGAIQESLTFPDLFRIKGVEFSRNGRYFYVADFLTPIGTSPHRRDLYQYDLENPNVVASRSLIDTYTSNTTYHGSANVLSLGPDGKIYVAGELYADTLGCINAPELPGVQCDFTREALFCPWPWITLPAPVKRYHDDALSGLGIADNPRPMAISLRPNPTHDRIQLSGLPSSARSFALRDAMGRVVLGGPLVQSIIDLSALASGSYAVEVLDSSGRRLGAARVMKE